MVRYEAINFQQKLALFQEQWQPKVIAELNDYQFKVVRLEGTSYGMSTAKRTKRSLCSRATCQSIFVMAR